MQLAPQDKRRTQITEGVARHRLSSWRKQWTSIDTGRSLEPRKKHDWSSVSNTKCNNTAVLPPTAPSFEIWPDPPALYVSQQESVDEVVSKLTFLLDAVSAGKSIAERTAHLAPPNQRGNPEMIAKSQMTPQEYETWMTFNDGLWRLPVIDWHNNQLPPHTSTKSLKTARRRAEALNRLYKTDRAREGHVTWIAQNMVELLPLMKATARVIGAERNLGGVEEWHTTQLTEIQSVNKILSITAQICRESESELVRSKCAEAQRVLGTYRRTLRSLRLRRLASTSVTGKEKGESAQRECDDSSGGIP